MRREVIEVIEQKELFFAGDKVEDEDRERRKKSGEDN